MSTAHRWMLAYSRSEDRQTFMIDGRVMEEGRLQGTYGLRHGLKKQLGNSLSQHNELGQTLAEGVGVPQVNNIRGLVWLTSIFARTVL